MSGMNSLACDPVASVLMRHKRAAESRSTSRIVLPDATPAQFDENTDFLSRESGPDLLANLSDLLAVANVSLEVLDLWCACGART